MPLPVEYNDLPMAFTFILNPAAGKYRAGKEFRHLQILLKATGIDHQLVQTEKPGHAIELAFRAADSSSAVIAVGGDGTVQEVATGLIGSGRPVSLGVIPLGSGNDFVKMLGMPTRVGPAVAAILTARERRVDYGLLRWIATGPTRQRVFVNQIGMGFDAAVAARVLSQRLLPGMAGYLMAVFQMLASWRSPHVHIRADRSGDTSETLFEGQAFLACAGNGSSSGGGFLLTPEASITDGLLDVCLVRDVSAFRALQLLPGVMKGKHITAPEVNMDRTAHLFIDTEEPVPVHADGEIVAENARRLDIEIKAGQLSVLSAI